MNARSLIVTWLVSISLCIIFIIAIALYPAAHLVDTFGTLPKEPIPQAPVIAIGSSLMRSAIPGKDSGYNGGILGDYRPHIRLAVSNLREEQALFLLNRVLDQKAEVVFLELNPFSFDFANQIAGKKINPVDPLSVATYLKEKSRFLALKLNVILKRSLPPLTAEDRRLTSTFKIKPHQDKSYPLHLRDPIHFDKLQRLINKAKAQSVQIILIAPPRSQWAAQYIGKKDARALLLHQMKLAKKLGVPLFNPGTFWPDDYFQDSAHMNAAGRQRFLEALSAWWEAQG